MFVVVLRKGNYFLSYWKVFSIEFNISLRTSSLSSSLQCQDFLPSVFWHLPSMFMGEDVKLYIHSATRSRRCESDKTNLGNCQHFATVAFKTISFPLRFWLCQLNCTSFLFILPLRDSLVKTKRGKKSQEKGKKKSQAREKTQRNGRKKSVNLLVCVFY